MEQRILEIIALAPWIWMKELELHFQQCDLLTRRTNLDPEFKGAIINLTNQGLIKISVRLEMKGYYKKWGEIVEKTDAVSSAHTHNPPST